MGSNRIAPMPTTPAKNTADIAIEMQPTHLSTGSLHSQAAQTEPDNNDQSMVYALSKSSGYTWIQILYKTIRLTDKNFTLHSQSTFLKPFPWLFYSVTDGRIISRTTEQGCVRGDKF